MVLEELNNYIDGLDGVITVTPTIEIDPETLTKYVTKTVEVYNFDTESAMKEKHHTFVDNDNFCWAKKKHIDEKVNKKTGETLLPETYQLTVCVEH